MRVLLLVTSIFSVGVSHEVGSGGQMVSASEHAVAPQGRSNKEQASHAAMPPPFIRGNNAEWWTNTDLQEMLQLRPPQVLEISLVWKEHTRAQRPIAENLRQRWSAIDKAIAGQAVTPVELRTMLLVAEGLRSDGNINRIVALYKIYLVLDSRQRTLLGEWLDRQSPVTGRPSR